MQKITFATNVAKNTLPYLKLLLHSLKINLDNDEHEILVFIDSDNENCLEYLLSVKSEFKDLTIIQNTLSVPIGYSRNKTLISKHAKYDIVSYLQADMVIGPHYDTEILKHTKPGRILSATRVEPPLHGESPVTITNNLGLHPDEFNLDKWNKFSESVKRDETIEYFFAPMTYYKEDWIRLDGYDTAFRRGREDSDFVQRCLHANIEMIQTFSANVYHFTCVSSRGKDWYDRSNLEAQQRLEIQKKADKVEFMRFIRKWGGFNHGSCKLRKLDIDLLVKNCPVQLIEQIEPFFNKVWVQTQTEKDQLISTYNANHAWANILLQYSDSEWETYKHLFRQEDFNNIFNVGHPTDYSVLVAIDFNKVVQGNVFLNNLHNLHEWFSGYEAGEYEVEGVSISIRKIQELPLHLTAQNPEFDEALLKVY